MRISVALALYVSLGAVAFANGVHSVNKDWAAVHQAGITADQQQRYDEAIYDFRQSWSLATTGEEQAISANDIGQAYRQAKKWKEAQEWLERACAILTMAPNPGHLLVVSASSLGDLYRNLGDYAHAETFLREALAAEDAETDSADAIRNDLADLVREEGRLPEARELFSTSLVRTGQAWQQRVNSLTGLADIDQHSGNRSAGENEWNLALEIARAHGDGRSEAVALRGLGSFWLSGGNLARAEPLLRKSLALFETDPASGPEDVATALFNLGQLYRAGNKLALAEDAWSRALEIERKAFGDLHPQVAQVEEMLAEVYARRGEHEPAAKYASDGVESMRCLFGENAMPTAVAFANRAIVEQLTGEFSLAMKDLQHALTIVRANPRNESLQKALTEKYAALLKASHHEKQAKAELSMLRGVQ